MTFPTGTVISTTNLDSPDDDPSLARVDLLALVEAFNQLIASKNDANGVVVLDFSGKIGPSYLPGSWTTSSGNIQLQPNSGIVNISRVLRLAQLSTDELGIIAGTTSPSAGDMCFLVDGDAGNPCLSLYDGTAWRVVRLMTQVGGVGVSIASTTSITADAD